MNYYLYTDNCLNFELVTLEDAYELPVKKENSDKIALTVDNSAV